MSGEAKVLLLLVRLSLKEGSVLAVLLRLPNEVERANFPVLATAKLCPIHRREDVVGLNVQIVSECDGEDEDDEKPDPGHSEVELALSPGLALTAGHAAFTRGRCRWTALSPTGAHPFSNREPAKPFVHRLASLTDRPPDPAGRAWGRKERAGRRDRPARLDF